MQCYSKPPCFKTEGKVYCNKCNRTFYGPQCYSKHLSTHICEKYKVCTKCYASYYALKNENKHHECGIKYCVMCQSDKNIPHDCYIPPISISSEDESEEIDEENARKKKRKSSDQVVFVFFDFETVQNKLLPGSNERFQHIVNLAVAQHVCNSCKTIENIDENCVKCGKREHIFLGENSLDMFMNYLINTIDKKFKKVICIAHNMKGFDGQFCLRYMYKNNSKWGLGENSLIINGTKIMKISVGRFIFLDSVNYLCSPLSKLPKMFNINHKKGWFPHLFHTHENINFIGSYPDKKFYSPDTMNENERKEFLKWYEEKVKSGSTFCLKFELIEYCKIDVDILRKACMRFRSVLMDKTKVDPFNGPITIASTCMKVFRTMYLNPNTIAIIPWNGYRKIDNQSIKAIKWLCWITYKNKINIQTADNGREFRLPINIKVDGFCQSTNTVYEFLGILLFFSSLFHTRL